MGENKDQSVEAKLGRAQELERKGQLDEAIVAYGLLFGGNSTGFKPWVMPAANGLIRSMWKRNSPATEMRVSDRQWAYQKLSQFLERTERLTPKMGKEELQQWNELAGMKQRFEASGEVKMD